MSVLSPKSPSHSHVLSSPSAVVWFNSLLTHLHASRLVSLLSALPTATGMTFSTCKRIISSAESPSMTPFYLCDRFLGPWHILKGWFIILLLANCPLPSAKIPSVFVTQAPATCTCLQEARTFSSYYAFVSILRLTFLQLTLLFPGKLLFILHILPKMSLHSGQEPDFQVKMVDRTHGI